MNPDISSLLIGILVMLSVYIVFSRSFNLHHASIRKSIALFSAVLGLLTTLWLREHPSILDQYTNEIVVAALAILLAVLGYLRQVVNK